MGESKCIAQLKIQSSLTPNAKYQKLWQSLLIVRQIKVLAGLATAYVLLSLPVQASPAKVLSQTSIVPENIPGTIVISRLKIIGNRVIPQKEIDEILAPYLFKPISFVELLEVQQAIAQLYIKRGYLTSSAYIPPQTIKDRTIRIKIIEGKIEEIKISGLNKLQPEYIRSRIAIALKIGYLLFALNLVLASMLLMPQLIAMNYLIVNF